MADEDFRPSYPAWMLVGRNSVTWADDGTAELRDPVIWLTVDDNEGRKAVPVFADDGGAMRFCATAGLREDAACIPVDNAMQLANMLRLIEQSGFAALVTFDPGHAGARAGRSWPIHYAAGRIGRGLGLDLDL
jgi:hypothetical protein